MSRRRAADSAERIVQGVLRFGVGFVVGAFLGFLGSWEFWPDADPGWMGVLLPALISGIFLGLASLKYGPDVWDKLKVSEWWDI